MLLSPSALKPLYSIEKMQPRMMVAIFSGNHGTTIISCYNPIYASDLITFYNELSFLVRCIPKHDVLIIVGDMNKQIVKDENNKSYLRNSSNRNWERLTEFSLGNRLTCLNTF